jgi:[ribosomal protein S18]-alanine N-acetyltransferase
MGDNKGESEFAELSKPAENRLQYSPFYLSCQPMSEPETIHIRTLIEPDLDAVLAIEQASFSSPWKRDHFLHEIAAPHSYPFVAEYNGMLAGYVCMTSLFEEAQILNIAVDPAMRGRGIARMLLERAFALAREMGAEVMALEVRASNMTAIALYEQCGFIRTGLRQKYYEGRDDAVLMEKILK